MSTRLLNASRNGDRFSGQPIPMFDHPLCEESLPNIQTKLPLEQCEIVPLCSITCHLRNETDTFLAETSFYLTIWSHCWLTANWTKLHSLILWWPTCWRYFTCLEKHLKTSCVLQKLRILWGNFTFKHEVLKISHSFPSFCHQRILISLSVVFLLQQISYVHGSSM